MCAKMMTHLSLAERLRYLSDAIYLAHDVDEAIILPLATYNENEAYVLLATTTYTYQPVLTK